MTDSTRVFDPLWRATDSNGDPVSGAKIKFYDAGTTTPRTVYSNSALSSSLGSIVYCGSDGLPVASQGSSTEVSVYTGTSAYKVVITDDSDVEIATYDNLLGALDTSSFLTTSSTSTLSLPVVSKTSDYTIVAGDRSKVINANATGGDITLTMTAATTLGDGFNVEVKHAGTANSVILSTGQTFAYSGITSTTYTLGVGETAQIVCDAAGFHIINAIPAPTISQPQGYLTPVSATPVISTDATSVTAIYYTPKTGVQIPIWNGSRFTMRTFSEMTLTLSTSHSANSIYDVFCFSDSGVLRLVTGPVWSTLTAGSGARGTGAGTTQISRVNGLWTNTVAMTARNGSSTYSVSAGYATYLGSIYIDGSNGQITCHTTWGQSRKWGIWNAYNRHRISMLMGDSTATFSGTTALTTFAQANGSANNVITTLCGLPEESIDVGYLEVASTTAGNAGGIGVGVNSTSAASGTIGYMNPTGNVAVVTLSARHIVPAGIGINNLRALISGLNTTFSGTQQNMTFNATYMG